MLLVGLTGGIGSGKTLVANEFRSLGVLVLEADSINRELTTNNPSVLAAIKARFGAEYFKTDGALDRAKLRSLIFKDNNAKEYLEALLHPLIKERIISTALNLPPDTPYIIVEVPLLLETDFHQLFHRILVVDCTKNLQLTRVQSRDAMPKDAIEDIINSQMSRQQRLQKAHDIIINEGTRQELQVNVKNMHAQYSLLTKISSFSITEAS